MTAFIIKRLLWFVPISLILLVIIYLMYNMTAYDKMLTKAGNETLEELSPISERELLSTAVSLGMNKPAFYFSLLPAAIPDEYFSNYDPHKKKWIRSFAAYFGDRTVTREALVYYDELIKEIPFQQLRFSDDIGLLKQSLLESSDTSGTEQQRALLKLINQGERNWSGSIPVPRWHGTDNRFHRFITSFFSRSGLRSEIDGQAVFDKLYSSASITLGINLLAMLFILLISIPFGLWIFRKRNQTGGHLGKAILYGIYALPLFWLATLIMMFSHNIGTSFLTGGIPRMNANEVPSLITFMRPDNLKFLFLPILTIVISGISYLAIQMYRAAEDIHDKKYILAAHAKGLKETYITHVHNKPNAIHTIITIIGNALPGLISGSIVIELIFNIPGMGRLLWTGLFNFDWPLVSAIMLLAIIFSIIGQLLADYLYVRFNPQIRYVQ